MHGLDEVSRKIGELEADAEHAIKQRAALFKLVAEIKDDLSRVSSDQQRILAWQGEFDRNMKPLLEEFQRWKQRGFGLVLLFLTAAMGGGVISTAWINELLKPWSP